MFNFFKNKEEERVEGESSLTYYIKEDGEIFCDISLVDYEEDTIKNFAKLIVGVSSLRFQVQTIEMVQNGFMEEDRVEEYEKLLRYVVLMTQQDTLSLEETHKRQKSEEEPFIKPSDML